MADTKSGPPKFGGGGKQNEDSENPSEAKKGATGLSQSYAGSSKPRYGGGFPRSGLSQSQSKPDESGEEEKHSSKKESNGMIIETFEKPLIPDLALNHNWTIWELLDTKGGGSYSSGMEKVAWFGDIITFWKAWNQIPHSDPKNFFSFTREGKSYANYYEVKGSAMKISTLAMFKSGIHPAWEDATNKNGGEYAAKVDTNAEATCKVWSSLVFDLVTSNFPATDRVCGIRIVDKGRILKVELWVDYGLRKYCDAAKAQEERMIEICREAGTSGIKFDFQAHA
ncbi:unnamed protein product [Moneuplotes crassus]|uniref:Eukaryotic translation initiation factor 4E n=1 Tax=Euplotes crassus TaxID=5936 RepID=A0AAD1XQE4_EUPCR|nr:unnamed protein product [Moneuplotes crassus]